ncbi:MAG TPA: hypothetical protein VEX35_15005 [Allosphingosinicella sp.]|nr:hypothetical protein [Allosphingosinicella sp.]
MFELITSKRQSAYLIDRGDQAVILYDLSQSMALKRLLDFVEADRPYDEIAKLYAACAGLSVADESPALCAALLSMPVPQEGEYLHNLGDLLAHYQAFKATLPGLMFEWKSSLVDGYLLAHEMAHFLWKHPDELMTRLKSGAESAFEYALGQVCYENQPNFADIAQHWGELPKGPEELEKLRRDLVNRRRSHEAKRNHLIEEIACDAYALLMVSVIHMSVWQPKTDDYEAVLEGYLRFAQTFFLIVALSDLHQAMIRRAKHSVASGIETEKPADIADMHFRKMALIYSMTGNAMTCLPERLRQVEAFPTVLQGVQSVIVGLKDSFGALIAIPVTRLIRAQLLAFERQPKPAIHSEQPWHQKLAVAFGRDRPPLTYTESAVNALIGSAEGSPDSHTSRRGRRPRSASRR